MQMFYILSIKWSKTSDELQWYCKNDSGYTANLNDAGQYSAEQVTASPGYYNNGETTLAVPVETVDAKITAERDARVAAEDKLSEIDDILHTGEDCPAVEGARLVMTRLRALMDAIGTRYAALAAARACGEDVTEADMMAYDQAILGAREACIRFFDDDAEV